MVGDSTDQLLPGPHQAINGTHEGRRQGRFVPSSLCGRGRRVLLSMLSLLVSVEIRIVASHEKSFIWQAQE